MSALPPAKKRLRIPRFIRRIISVVLILVLFSMAMMAGLIFVNRLPFLHPTPLTQLSGDEQVDAALERAEKNIHLLLVGSDEREDEAARSDTIMYAILRPVDRQASLVSIPRDLRLNIPNVGEDKINHAYAYGEMPLLISTVENYLESPIDHVVHVNFASFQKVIDAMGGITIDVETDMYLPEENIDLKAGKQKLNGYDALAYVRWRDDGQGDLGRIERQQKFMQALTHKAKHLLPWRTLNVARILAQDIDTDLSFLDMVKISIPYVGMPKDAMQVYHFNTESFYLNDISYVRISDAEVRRIIGLMTYGIDLENTIGGEPYYRPKGVGNG